MTNVVISYNIVEHDVLIHLFLMDRSRLFYIRRITAFPYIPRSLYILPRSSYLFCPYA